MKALSPFALALLLSAAPAFASVTVSSPLNGSTVSSPFQLVATASPCSSQSISAMGYSLDSSTSTTIVKSTSISASVSATIGSHVLHVKSWGTSGASCTTNVGITVTQTTAISSNLTVTSPINGASVTSPFTLAASGTVCSSQPVTSLGYSLDSSTSTAVVYSTVLTAQVTAAAGAHTLHVKAWGAGVSCAANIAVTVLAPITTTSSPTIPSDAVAIKAIQNLSIWQAAFDTGTGGSGASATGAMQLVSSPSVSGSARQFVTTYTNYGGERYNVKVGTDAVSTNFVYDTKIYLASPSSDIANIEMDLNQVMSNGQTVIFGFQCDGWSNTWDYTENAGTPTSPSDKWVHSNQTCTPRNWSTNTWHHVQISYSRDSSGNVTYNGVWFDGVEQALNVTVPSAFALGWAPSLNINFQIDGMTSTSGSATVYLDNTTLYSW
ncbi:MAG TPA: hypothetical protein VG225_14295 [Terracidiphilus sp.]|nr:hypothetical protein [Terracidiphilus sp.]